MVTFTQTLRYTFMTMLFVALILTVIVLTAALSIHAEINFDPLVARMVNVLCIYWGVTVLSLFSNTLWPTPPLPVAKPIDNPWDEEKQKIETICHDLNKAVLAHEAKLAAESVIEAQPVPKLTRYLDTQREIILMERSNTDFGPRYEKLIKRSDLLWRKMDAEERTAADTQRGDLWQTL